MTARRAGLEPGLASNESPTESVDRRGRGRPRLNSEEHHDSETAGIEPLWQQIHNLVLAHDFAA